GRRGRGLGAPARARKRHGARRPRRLPPPAVKALFRSPRNPDIMVIRQIDLFHVELPLKSKVRHASHERSASDSLVVRVTLDDGTARFGEGGPRPYVTGDTVHTTFAALFGGHDDSAGVVRGLDGLVLPESAADPRGMAGNAARCALETAVLDAYGRRFGRSVGDAVRLADVPGLQRTARPCRVRYSGA